MRLRDNGSRGLAQTANWLEAWGVRTGREVDWHVPPMGFARITRVLFTRALWLQGRHQPMGWLLGTAVLKEGIVFDPLVSLSVLTVF